MQTIEFTQNQPTIDTLNLSFSFFLFLLNACSGIAILFNPLWILLKLNKKYIALDQTIYHVRRH